jgi:hypothetical protein
MKPTCFKVPGYQPSVSAVANDLAAAITIDLLN